MNASMIVSLLQPQAINKTGGYIMGGVTALFAWEYTRNLIIKPDNF